MLVNEQRKFADFPFQQEEESVQLELGIETLHTTFTSRISAQLFIVADPSIAEKFDYVSRSFFRLRLARLNDHIK